MCNSLFYPGSTLCAPAGTEGCGEYDDVCGFMTMEDDHFGFQFTIGDGAAGDQVYYVITDNSVRGVRALVLQIRRKRDKTTTTTGYVDDVSSSSSGDK